MTFHNNDDDGNDDNDGASPRRAARRQQTPRQRPPRTFQPREPRAIDAAQLGELALGYAARYATTAEKLRRYLMRKLGERHWTPADPPDIDTLVARLTSLGYVDDRAWAASKARELGNRGFGQRRIASALAAAGVDRDDSAAVFVPEDAAAESPYISAIAFARRRRFGPFARGATTGAVTADPQRQRRELAAMARAGHDFEIARRVLGARDEAAALALID
jgi:regulatory protein